MIPIRDTIPSKKFPIVTVSLIVANVLIFLFEISLGNRINQLIDVFGMVPFKYFYLTRNEWSNFIDRFYPFFTSMFLHGGWMHMIGNMWFLWIFGDNVEDAFGRKKFLFFYVLCGLIGGFAHAYMNTESTMPTVGASGAIAGVMGAYLLLFPQSRVLMLIPFFYFFQFVEIRSYYFLGLWFIIQIVAGTVDLATRTHAIGGIAWWAHIGGYLVGIGFAIIYLLRVRIMRTSFDL